MALLAATPAAAQMEVPAAQAHLSTLPWNSDRLPDVKPVQVELNPDIIDRFLASLPVLIALSRDLDLEVGRIEPAKLDENLALLLVPHLFPAETEEAINEKLGEFGFTSYTAWANVARSIGLAADAAQFSKIDLSSFEQAERRDVENDPALSPEQRAQKIEDIKSRFTALVESQPLPGNREAVGPYLQRLRTAIGG
jgi:hypothetical protein